MSFQLNSDREQLRGVDSTIIGSGSVRIRAGQGSDEREIFQAKIDLDTNLPRVGINRTGRRIDSIKVLTQGLNYTSNPTIEISAPTLVGGVQAIASASTDSLGRITSIGIDNPGDGYAIAPTVTITGGGGSGATAEAFLDTIDFELDVNGAIRTSTSIISDTANILNLDIDNLVTPDIKVRAPDLKTWANGTGEPWPSNTKVDKDDYYWSGTNMYQILNTGITSALPPFHEDGVELNGEVGVKHIGYRVDSDNLPFYGETGNSGIFPRSITPVLGDKSDKIATTEYVLNLATNDVGGRIYVSEQIGDDDNDGRSPVNPVRTIKKACQLAWATPGVKESIIIAGGEYNEDNPISIPPDASIVGDNLRLVIIRPINTGKHIFKFGDKNYVIGVTYQDKINATGGSIGTWDYAMVFDDKQRLSYDATANGDFGTNFPIGHQFFGNESFAANFTFNLLGLDQLVAGIEIFGVNSQATGVIGEVIFDETDPTATDTYETGRLVNIVKTDGEAFNNAETFFYGGAGSTKWQPTTDYSLGDIVWTDAVLGDQSLTAYVYEVTTAGTSGVSAPTHNTGVDTNGTVGLTFLRNAYSFNASQLVSTTPEGEVVFEGDDPFSTDTQTLPVYQIDFSLQGTFTDGFQSEIYGNAEDLGGIVIYTNPLDGALNTHDFKEGDEVVITGMPSAPNDLTFLNGKQRIYKVIEDADGRSRRFVIPKKIPVSYGLNAVSDWDPSAQGAVVSVKTFTKSATLTLLNTPNKFPIAQPLARRYQDACLQLRNNIDFIADEVVGKLNDEFKQEYFFPYDIGQGGGNDFKIYLGTSRFAHSWVSGGTVTAGGVTYNVTGFDYDYSATGEAEITLDSAPAFSEDDTILLAGMVVECVIDGVTTQKTYPSLNIPISDTKCRRDVGHFLNALIRDLEFGSNYNIIDSAKKYIDAGQIEYVDYEIIQTVRGIEYARELAIYAIRKWRTGDGSPGQTVYVPQYSNLDQYIDPTIIDDTATPACANVVSAINTLSYLFVDVLANDASGTYLDAAYLIARNRHHIADEAYKTAKNNYPSLTLNNIDERKCRRDINYILTAVLRDLVLGGNTGSVSYAELYYTGTNLTGVPIGELGATRYAFEKVRDLSIQAMRNWKTATGTSVTPNYTIIPQFTDNTILVDADGTPTAQLTPTDATYDPATGDFVMTFAAPHGVTTNESIRLEIESFVFTCAMDNYRSEHYLPESDQPAATTLLPVTSVTANTITVNVGASGADQSWTPTNATYDPATGDFVITLGAGHGLTTGEGIVLDDNSFTFTCNMDDNDAQKTYPRPDIDPFAGRSMKITGSTETSITVNVGASGPNKTFQPTNATYDAATGDMVVTVGQHGLGVGRSVVLADNSFTFTCDMDNNATEKSYPRPGIDPFAGKSIAITSVGVTTHSPSNANYNPAAGTLDITLANHGFNAGDYIKIDDNAITFTCDLDGNATQHTYPRSYEYASGRWFEIAVPDINTIRISGLPIPRDTSNHTYVNFAPNSISRQDGTFTINVGTAGTDVQFTPTNATYDPSNGDLELTIGTHSLVAGEGIVIADNSLSFSCDMDNRDSTKTYPRPGIDPYAGRSIPIKSVTSTTITVDAGISGPNKYFTPTAATYSPVTGDMTVTVGQHGLGVGRSVVLEDNSFTFTCLTDPNDPKTYPRPGTDPYAGKSIPITAVGSTSHDVTDAPYDPSTGIITLTVANHGFSNGDYIKVADGSLTYTCDLDGNTVQKSYPRAGYDYPSGRWLQINGVTTDTFQINVGSSSYTGNHTYVGGTASNAIERQDGTFTIFVGTSSDTSAHTFVSATTNAIKHEPQSTHYFEGATTNAVKHLPQSTHTFVRATSTAVQHLPQSTHTFVSATTGAVKHLPQSTHQFERVTGTNVVAAYPSGGSAVCANVEASLVTSFALIDGILEFAVDQSSPTAIQPGVTVQTYGTLFETGSIINYPDNVLRDASGNTVTIRSIYDDLPIISASPYTQNSSIISKRGGSGALVDGSKVKSPNCPFPGLTDGEATFPNQGKSMVASAFTIVSEQNGTGYKIIEDGYVQLVSVFCIFTVDGILCESGGYASVTNSASNFGVFSLRATGYREEAYTFDAGYQSSQGYQRAFIDAVILAESGQTQLTLADLGRAPLEDYILKVDGHETLDSELEYTIIKVNILQDGPPFRAEVEVSDGQGAGPIELKNSTTGLTVAPGDLDGLNFSLHRPSIVNSSSHTFEFVGSGTKYDALPENGGIKVAANEMVSESYGRVYASGTDELGDFKVGDFVIIENRTGNIQFKGTVSISEVDFLKLSGSGVTITGFSDLSTLGGDDADDKTLPTQKAVRDFIINNLGQYIGKGFTTNQVPRALVELTDTGLISEAQLPSTSPIEVYSVNNEQERLALEGVRAGDIAVESGEAYILNTDNDSLFLGIAVDTSLQFTVNDIFTGNGSGGKIQLTEYRPGVLKRIYIPDGGGGAGYSTSNPPTVVITDTGTSVGHVAAAAQATVAGGQVVAIDIIEANGYKGGIGYNSTPVISFTNTSGGAGATATAEIESRLYGDIANGIKIVNTDSIESSDVPAETVDVVRVVNTSASDINNWVALNTGTVSAGSIVDGPIPTDILSDNAAEANSNTFLAGDSSYKKAVKSIRKIEQRYFLTTATDSITDTMLFEVNSTNPTGSLVVGHGVVASSGIQVGTTISQIASVQVGTDNFVRITLSDGLVSTVPAGTIVEFSRPEAPIIVSSLLSTPGSIDQILIEDGGSGFNDNDPGVRVFNNLQVGGGTQTTGGTDALMDITVSAGVVTLVNVINAGSNFTGDFTVTPPNDIGTAGSGLILRAKIATEAKQEGDIRLDVQRATSDTLNADEFGTVGVARFKKSQFILGDNGSVQIDMGIDSGLDADLLDGKQGSFYRNADNFLSGTLDAAFLSGTYAIDITGESGNTITLSSQTGSLTTDLPPQDIRAGATVAVRQNQYNNLLDPAEKPNPGTPPPDFVSTASDYNTVLSIRGGGTGTTNQYGGVLQLGFTNGNNVFVRGSSGSVASTQTWSDWGKLWSSRNDYTTDPANSSEVAGPNAYRLRNRTGKWYLDATTSLYGTLGDRRLPTYQTRKDFNNRLRILTGVGNGINYRIYISNVDINVINKFDAAPFTSSPPVIKLLTASGDDPGQIRITDISVYDIEGNVVDTSTPANIDDYTSLYAIVSGTLEQGGFVFTDANGDSFPAEFIGDNTSEVRFDDYSISSIDINADGMPDGNVEMVRLESANGTPRMILGREDGLQGSSTTPQIWFRSSDDTPADTTNWYNSGFQASGGNDNNGSGTLNVLVTDPDAFTVGSNIVWNAGNTLITATNTGSTYSTSGGNSEFDSNFPDNNVTIRSLVMRDEDGNFSANVITADLTGTASGNLPINGGILTGGLQIGDSNNDASLVVYGTSTFNGNLDVVDAGNLTVDTNVFVVDSTNDRIGIGTASPGVRLDLFQFTNTSASDTGTTLLRLTNNVRQDVNDNTGDIQGINGQKSFIDFRFQDFDATFTPQVRIGAQVGETSGTDNGVESEGSGSFVVYTGKGSGGVGAGTITEKFRVDPDGNVGIATAVPEHKLHVAGDIYTSTNVTAKNSMNIGLGDVNAGAALLFLGATGGQVNPPTDDQTQISNFRIGNKLLGNDILEFTANDGSQGSSTWKSVPALAIQGSYNRVAINTDQFSGVDSSGESNITRRYQLNVQGDMNLNGDLYQDNKLFVTSRWTESSDNDGNNIYRNSFVGIGNISDPAYQLDVAGDINMTGKLYVSGIAQWLDAGGVIKVSGNTINEDVTIPAGAVASSIGPVIINSNNTVDIATGATWTIL